MRYSAFISYNHRDRKAASWLHRALETYRIPKRLQGREGALGVIGSRLPPIFQDREELAASSDLAASVREALENAATLIVICSPNAVASRWVNEEIRAFTALGRRDRIQCLIVGGEPHAASRPGVDPALECLPPVLFEGGAGEPLACDIRPGQDDRSSARLKLLAGILGVGYDELRQREQARRQRQMFAAASVSSVGFLVMSGLTAFALVSRNEAIHQRDIARQKTLTAERTVGFVKSLFEVADPSEARGDTITAREILDRGAHDLDQGLEGEPTVKAELTTTLGEVYNKLGLFHEGEATVRKALALKGVDPSTAARQYTILGEIEARLGDYPAAAKTQERALALLKGRGPEAAALMPRAWNGLGAAQGRLGDYASAEKNLRRALQADIQRLGDSHDDVALDLEGLGEIEFYKGDLAGARRDVERAIAIRSKTHGPRYWVISDDLNTLASIAYMAQDRATAELDFSRALAGYEAVLGPDHPQVAGALNNLARVELEQQSFAKAEPLLRRAVGIDLAKRADSDDLAFEYANLAIAERGLGRLQDADDLFAKAERVARIHKHRNLAPILVERAEIACERGASAQGFRFLGEAGPIMKAVYPDDAWRTAWVEAVRGDCLTRAGRVREGAPLLRANAAVISARWGKTTLYGGRLLAMQKRAGMTDGSGVSRP
ncbi:toll/interleukin-1 receptor domain-containing protein [Phenylobacterium sp.]|uniref:toll/interleukin-1 receptor domain-containing protein n=1 Tax=Phenylobacterium sp. TaxID=1871053 RepID=UPI002CD328DE|nr:toll/interleukin-1 receptor domain-containing protein [Phenylobacterium sp.]HLZ77292.1 toll/interleukin-1 receptor domain-containing protein [Phenylobacterium sp.]